MTGQSFSEIAGLDGVYIARAGKLNCTAFRLCDGGLCLYSPVAGLEVSQRDRLAALGGVSAILAPNHYHNMGLKAHAKAFVGASLMCSKAAEPRLESITGLAFEPLDALRSQRLVNQTIMEPEGLKTGEIWVQIETPSQMVWIVGDAFTAPLLGEGAYAQAPGLLANFPRYGVKDASAYRDWVMEQISSSRPTVLLSCHGSVVKSAELGGQLAKLLKEAC
jgi:hypothetical protein